MRTIEATRDQIRAVMSRLTGKNLREVAEELHISVDQAARASHQWAYDEAARAFSRI